MDRLDEMPYCIWHSKTTPETMYRKLYRRYPQRAYQVGRAYAVAGYFDLYKELGILPEVYMSGGQRVRE